MDIKALKARWGWTTLLTFVVMAVLGYVDARVKAASGVGVLDLEFSKTAAEVEAILGAWRAAGVDDEMAFLLGLDFLYMPAYGFALFYGTLAAREAFAPSGTLRRILTAAAFAPLIGAGLDVFENASEARMLFVGVDPTLVCATYYVTLVKFAAIFVGLAAALLGVAGLAVGRLKTTSAQIAR